MIFKIRNKAEPKIGDTKIIKKIAWLPTKINSTTIVWLEKYYIKYQLYSENHFDSYGNIYSEKYWSMIDCWTKINKKYMKEKYHERKSQRIYMEFHK